MQVARFERFAGGARFERIVEICGKAKSPHLVRCQAVRTGDSARDSSLALLGMTQGEGASDQRRVSKMARQARATKEAERFLSAQADPFTGVKGEEKVGLLRSE
jgi:hypothetical protein